MNTQYMKVNPNELVIDLPVDETNVQKKMDSMRLDGVVGQPIAIWLNGSRIIDGFHRTVAAQRLGWAEIDCVVTDCDEERFWDLRIQSAKQHASVEQERLEAWIWECWNASQWDDELLESEVNEFNLDDEGVIDFIKVVMEEERKRLDVIDFSCLQKDYHAPQWESRFLSVCFREGAKTWTDAENLPDEKFLNSRDNAIPASYLKKARQMQDRHLLLVRDKEPKVEFKKSINDFLSVDKKRAALLLAAWNTLGDCSNEYIRRWFQDKSEKWGIPIKEVIRVIFRFVHPEYENLINVQHLAGDVSLLQYYALNCNQLIAKFSPKKDEENKDQYLDRIRRRETEHDLLRKKDSEECINRIKTIQDENESIRREREIKELQRQEYLKSPAGQAELRKNKLSELEHQFDFIAECIIRLNISKFPEVARRLTSLIDLVENKIEESFPDLAQKTKVNPIIAENIELRRQAEEQKRKIESLERALNSKQGSTKMLPKTQAFSSIEIEAMA